MRLCKLSGKDPRSLFEWLDTNKNNQRKKTNKNLTLTAADSAAFLSPLA